MGYIKLHTEVVDGVQKISSFASTGLPFEQSDLYTILHALAPRPDVEIDTFTYDFGMSF